MLCIRYFTILQGMRNFCVFKCMKIFFIILYIYEEYCQVIVFHFQSDKIDLTIMNMLHIGRYYESETSKEKNCVCKAQKKI